MNARRYSLPIEAMFHQVLLIKAALIEFDVIREQRRGYNARSVAAADAFISLFPLLTFSKTYGIPWTDIFPPFVQRLIHDVIYYTKQYLHNWILFYLTSVGIYRTDAMREHKSRSN